MPTSYPIQGTKAAYRRTRKALICLLPVLGVTVLIATVYLHDNRSGAKEWNWVRDQLIAANLDPDPTSFMGLLPEPDDNFATHPLIASCYPDNDRDTLLHARLSQLTLPGGAAVVMGGWLNQSEYRYDRVLTKMGVANPPLDAAAGAELWFKLIEPLTDDLDQIDEAAKRNHASLPFAPPSNQNLKTGTDGPTPNYTLIREHAGFQRFRAAAALQLGRPDEALNAIRVMTKMAELSSSNPTTIGILFDVVITRWAIDIILEGIDAAAWSSVHFHTLGELLRRRDLAKTAERAYHGDLVFYTLPALELQKANWNPDDSMYPNYDLPIPMRFLPLIPHGVWDRCKARLGYEILSDCVLRLRKTAQPSPPPSTMTSFSLAISDRLLDTTLRSSLHLTVDSVIQTHVLHQLVQVNCAIECYRSVHGTLPNSLSELVPQYLTTIPKDYMDTSRDLTYLPGQSSYRLYSVGFNRSDDNGEVSWIEGRRRNYSQGDWATHMPGPQPPAN